jgi:hypothetical protein
MFDKLCRFFEEAEKDHRLFSDSNVRGCLEAMLEQLYVDLNSRNECLLRLESHFAYLTLNPAKKYGQVDSQKKREINNKIPIMQKKIECCISQIEGRDMMLVCILKFINGKNSIFQIKKKALKRMLNYKPQEQNLDDLIYKKLLDLRELGIVFFTDMFFMDNVYILQYEEFVKIQGGIKGEFEAFCGKVGG